MNRTLSPKFVMLAAGTALTVASAASAQQLVNVSGASLLGSFIRSQSSVNDYIGVTVQTPAAGTRITDWTTANGLGAVGPWAVNYRISGSLNGFDELVQYGYPQFVASADDRTAGTTVPLNSLLITDGYYNNGGYLIAGVTQAALYNNLNTGGAPRVGTALGNPTVSSSNGGITIDVAYVDVPAIYGLVSGSAANADPVRKPTQDGFGLNTRNSVGTDGNPATGISNQLGNLGTRNLADFPGRNVTTDPYNANTIFEYPLTLSPVAPIANPGTGLQRLRMSDLRFTFATGRLPSGENLMVATRDIGSGTRNAFNNHSGLDPSFGVGDNVGGLSTVNTQDQLGATFQSTNKGATSGMLRTVRYHRLALGYAGAETGRGTSPNGYLTDQSANIVDIFNDLYYTPAELATLFPSGPSASDYKRPTIGNILLNNRDGWVITGQAVIATIGDPKAESDTFRTATLPNNGGRAANAANPQMNNKTAARYVNNILRSIDDFNATTVPATLVATPAEFLATNFTLQSAAQNLSPASDPTARFSQTPNSFANSFALANSTFANSVFSTPNTGAFVGLSPRRAVLTTGLYSDQRGTAALNSYISQSGNNIAYEANPTQNGEPVMNRNKIAYDFNGDGVRSFADVNDMIAAFRQRANNNTGPVWSAPSGAAGNGLNACIEILGDGNGDGSFTAADVRYWADGLALVSGSLDRKAGFTAVDNAWLAATGAVNFFGTTISTGKPYAAGDSRADVSNAAGRTARGYAPVGADGVIDINDLNYVLAQFNQPGITGSADWSNLSEAARFDLSADLTGDLKVDQDDVTELVRNIMGTCTGDLNLDGKVTLAERATVQANVGTLPATWARGDLNGDGVINAADVSRACPADINCDASVSVQDIFDFLSLWFQGSPKADINGAAGVSTQDIFDFLQTWFAGNC